jgi:hypothetical protein
VTDSNLDHEIGYPELLRVFICLTSSFQILSNSLRTKHHAIWNDAQFSNTTLYTKPHTVSKPVRKSCGLNADANGWTALIPHNRGCSTKCTNWQHSIPHLTQVRPRSQGVTLVSSHAYWFKIFSSWKQPLRLSSWTPSADRADRRRQIIATVLRLWDDIA